MRHEINFHDAQQALGFIVPQQLRIETRVYETRYPSFQFEDLMYVNEDGDMWDIGSVFYSGDIAGKAEWFDTAAFDMPHADVSSTQFLRENYLAAIGYEWHLSDLRRAEKLGQNLPDRKARAARRVAQQFKYRIAILGNTQKNMTGLINNASVPRADVAADGAGGGGGQTEWENKTPDQILRDINAALYAPANATYDAYVANTLLIPTSSAQYINGLRIGDGADTLRKFIAENNAYTLETGGLPLRIKHSRELETAGSGGTKRMMAYDRSEDVVQYHLPGDHTFLPVFQKAATVWEVGGIMNIGGVEFRVPKGAAYRDGL